jgi:hypothetical protein
LALLFVLQKLINRKSLMVLCNRYICEIFRNYLTHILLSSPDAFHLRLIDPATLPPHKVLILSTSTANKSSPILQMNILTPKFYYSAINFQDFEIMLLAAFLDPADENRTASGDDAMALVKLLARAATLAKQGQVNKSTTGWIDILMSLFWALWMITRVILPYEGAVYPNLGTPAARARTTEHIKKQSGRVSVDDHPYYGKQSRRYFLDDFVRDFYCPWGQIKYVGWGVRALIRERVVSVVGGA